MRRLIMSACLIALCGCHAKPVQLGYQCPPLILPEDPKNYTSTLHKKSSASDVVKAWVATAIEAMHWNKIVRSQVEKSK